MIEEKNFGVYINILCQTLQKKNRILDELLQANELQGQMVKSESLEVEEFQSIMEKKASLIEELNQLDNGFELSYNRIKDAFPVYKDKYKEIIQVMQENILEISRKVMEVQRLELKNKDSVELRFAEIRKKIKDFNVSSKNISNYYKNMSNAYSGEAQFMDKKK